MRWIVAAIVCAAGSAWAQAPDPGVFGNRFRFMETSGAAVYQSVCAGCHMADGRGAEGAGRYPSLVADPRLASAGYPIAVVLGGQRAMPAFGRLLSDRQVAEVVTYIRQNFQNNYQEVIQNEEIKQKRQ